MNLINSSDEELMSLLCQGENTALAELVRRYQTELLRFCIHYLKDVERSKDIVQEAFLRVYSACGRFDQSRKFRPWVLRISRNLCLNELKRKKMIQMDSFEEFASSSRTETGEVLKSHFDGPAEILEAEERRQFLEKALDTLSDDAREIVTLRFFERMSAKAIAEIVDSTEGAIRTKLHRILKSMHNRCIEFKDEL